MALSNNQCVEHEQLVTSSGIYSEVIQVKQQPTIDSHVYNGCSDYFRFYLRALDSDVSFVQMMTGRFAVSRKHKNIISGLVGCYCYLMCREEYSLVSWY